MKCFVTGKQLDYLAVVEETLGEGITFAFAEDSVDGTDVPDCDVILAPISSSDTPEFPGGLQTLRQFVLNRAGVPVIAFLPHPDRQAMREVIGAGAYDYFVQSGSMPELRIVLRRAAQFRELCRELQRAQHSAKRDSGFGSIVGADAKMMRLLALSQKVAQSDASVLITGETGTGKELLATAIHEASSRSQYPFVPVACSALPETLIEAELFGHEKGAFTGASSLRRGRFEAAGRGTIFLDEVGELTPSLQVKLLRVLQQCTFERIGSNQSRPMEARVICATNRDLQSMVQTGTFRADLYYRLNTIELTLPPLRERPDDIPLLAQIFLDKYSDGQKHAATRIHPAAMSAMRCHSWPGNVRELQHIIERAVIMSEGPEIRLEHLPAEIGRAAAEGLNCSSFEHEVRRFKRQLIYGILEKNNQNKVRAARSLRISRSSLHRLIGELGIDPGGGSETPS